MTNKISWRGVLALLAFTWGPGAAWAEDGCSSPDDCLEYESCEATFGMACPDGRPTCQAGMSDSECVQQISQWENENCTAGEVQKCLPIWMLPCAEDEDCGDGFTCESEQCHAVEIDCTSDEQCPQYWSCLRSESMAVPSRCNPPAFVGVGGQLTGGGTSSDSGDDDSESNGPEASDSSGCAFTAPYLGSRGALLWGVVVLVAMRRRSSIKQSKPTLAP